LRVDPVAGGTTAFVVAGSGGLLLPQRLAIPLTQGNKRQIEALKQRRAEREAHEFNTMSELAKGVTKPTTPIKVYDELGTEYYSVTSNTFIGQLFSMLGLVNIADDAKRASSGYPQLSSEYIVDADPDLIFLADTKCCGQDASTVAARPGWGDLAAVRDGNVVELDDDIASRWGPRLADLVQTIAEAAASADGAAA